MGSSACIVVEDIDWSKDTGDLLDVISNNVRKKSIAFRE